MLIAQCEGCGHWADVNVDALPETLRFPRPASAYGAVVAVESRSTLGPHGIQRRGWAFPTIGDRNGKEPRPRANSVRRVLDPRPALATPGTRSAKWKPIQKQVVHAAIDALFQSGVFEDG
jgi:hypothetical protein